jgi:DNA-binding NarL/FixJ family response regulator
MILKKVAVILNDYLIVRGVESLLMREIDLNVTSISYDSDGINGIVHHIEIHQPSIVIMDESFLYSDSRDLFNQLLAYPKLRLLVLGLRDNKINIYDHKEILVSQSADLISAIKGN